MTSHIDTDTLRETLAAATRGPWQEGELAGETVFAWNLPPDHPNAVICHATSREIAQLIAIAPDLAAETLRLRARVEALEALLSEAFSHDDAGLFETEYDGRVYELCQHCDYRGDVRPQHGADCLTTRARAALGGDT